MLVLMRLKKKMWLQPPICSATGAALTALVHAPPLLSSVMGAQEKMLVPMRLGYCGCSLRLAQPRELLSRQLERFVAAYCRASCCSSTAVCCEAHTERVPCVPYTNKLCCYRKAMWNKPLRRNSERPRRTDLRGDSCRVQVREKALWCNAATAWWIV